MMRKSSRPFSILVALLAVCMFGAVGFRVGRSAQTSASDVATAWQGAASTAYPTARRSAYRSAWRQGYHQGWKAGVAAGDAAGARAARAAGSTLAAVRTVAARAVAAVLAATPAKLSPRIKTERCIEVAGGLCEALGPRVTGKRCPSGSVADPRGGVVCVPQVLLLAARVANAPTVKLFTP